MSVVADTDKLDAIRGAIPAEGFVRRERFSSFARTLCDRTEIRKGTRTARPSSFCFSTRLQSTLSTKRKGKTTGLGRALSRCGKPPELVEFSRRKEFRDELPKVIRPDLILTDEGYTIAEIDSVPGGIGLTAWLNQTYTNIGADVIGGAEGMLDGFRVGSAEWRRHRYFKRSRHLSTGDGVDFRASQCETVRNSNGKFSKRKTTRRNTGRDVYRFFELFDLPNLPRVG